MPVISLFHLCNKRYHTCAGYPNFSTILEEWNNKNKKNKNEKERDVRLAEVIYSRFLRVARSGRTACRVSLDDGNVVCCHLPFTCPVLVISCYPLCRLYSLAKEHDKFFFFLTLGHCLLLFFFSPWMVDISFADFQMLVLSILTYFRYVFIWPIIDDVEVNCYSIQYCLRTTITKHKRIPLNFISTSIII